LDVLDAFFQEGDVIVIPGNMVTATEINPFEVMHVFAKLRLDRLKGFGQVIGVLLAKGMEMNAVEELKLFYAHPLLKGFGGDPEAGAWGARVLDVMANLGRAFRIDS
jgi:hypothetical protein